MSKICVIHLARRKNGIEPFKRFLESYTQNPCGIQHDLIIVFKGFSHRAQLEAYNLLLADFPHHSLRVSDRGLDLTAYFAAIKAFDYQYYCFLNSFSVILDRDWLLKLFRHISRSDVGLVGATGSWESMYTNCRLTIHDEGLVAFIKQIALNLLAVRFGLYFDRFPNYHIRTNGFIISSRVLRAIRRRFIFTKIDAHRFESGKNGLTKQILAMNLKVLVVGKDGKGYVKEDWHRSGTLRQGDQSNLLIADNQTIAFSTAPLEQKTVLSRCAWGIDAEF